MIHTVKGFGIVNKAEIDAFSFSVIKCHVFVIENCLKLPFEGLGIVDRLSKIRIHLLFWILSLRCLGKHGENIQLF